MAKLDFTLDASPAIGGYDRTIGQIRIRERDDLAIVSIATPLNGEAALAKALEVGFGIRVPETTMTTLSDNIRAVRTAPDQMMLIFPHDPDGAESLVASKIGDIGYTTDQSDAWLVLELSGPDTDLALERLSPVNLAADAFGVDGSARTVMEHIGALAIRTAPDTVLLLSARSYAESFLHAVETSTDWIQA